MFQVINDMKVYVVDLAEVPKSPIRSGGDPELLPYAIALDHAIRAKQIDGPGKYAIYVDFVTDYYNVFKVLE